VIPIDQRVASATSVMKKVITLRTVHLRNKWRK
jgi:hypothetical protein